MSEERRGAGGTPGGVGEFLVGVVMAAAGGFLLFNQVQVTTSFWHFWGGNSFGLAMLPLLVGIGLLFFNGRSWIGWLLSIAGLAIILAGILMNMDIYFRPTSLFNTVTMLVLLAGGLGLVANAEHYATPNLLERVQRRRVTTLGAKGRWLLCELPWSSSRELCRFLKHSTGGGCALYTTTPAFPDTPMEV